MKSSFNIPTWIRFYVIISAILITLMSIHSILQLTKKEWTAERINIVDPEGNPRMVISNNDPFFLRQNWIDEAGLFIHDRDGNLRMKIYVDAEDQPRIEFYAADGSL